MVQFTTFTVALAALAALVAGVQAGPCAVNCNPTNIIKDGDFEGDNSVWTFDSGVTIATNGPDSAFGAVGTSYVNFDVAQRQDRQRYGMAQALSGLTPYKPYTLQFKWELTDASGIYDGYVNIKTALDGVLVDSFSFKRDPLDIIDMYTVTITPQTADPVLYISCGGTGDYYYGSNIIMDNVAMGQLCSQSGTK